MSAAVPGRFEGSYLGDASRISATARMECKICWHVYDPAEGCDFWQVPAATPFSALPDEWRCPVCDGSRDQFMTLDDGPAPATSVPAHPSPAPALILPALPITAIQSLERTFHEIHIAQMRDVPIVNQALAVKTVGFRAWNGCWLGALVTPWFMNLVLLPGSDEDWSDMTSGARELIEFPSGTYEFVHMVRKGLGPYKACSLFSPMFEFTTMLQATETAGAALAAIFDPANREDGPPAAEIRRLREAGLTLPADPAVPAEPSLPSRRSVLGLKAEAAP